MDLELDILKSLAASNRDSLYLWQKCLDAAERDEDDAPTIQRLVDKGKRRKELYIKLLDTFKKEVD